MDPLDYFTDGFRALTGKEPFKWQKRLFRDHFIHADIPRALDIPTGLGKTSVMVIWLLALAYQAAKGPPSLARRLVYVVNRRTVVDQATDIAMEMREALREADAGALPAICKRLRDDLGALCTSASDEGSVLAISTLRGERADNREWQADPARPAIIIGTIDMIGSRLLFSGYGVSRRMRPFHAGFLGQDTLLVHDEAHLSPAFGALLRCLVENRVEQRGFRPLTVLELSATQRGPGTGVAVFMLTEEEKNEKAVASRLRASKRLRVVEVSDDKPSAIEKLVTSALGYKDQRCRVLVYVRKPSDAKAVAQKLAKTVGSERVALLTGTIRGHERDRLADTPLFVGFQAKPDRPPPRETEYLVATSAGEVGVDLDADHMVCDLSTLDSMIQRLGRVNRLGGREAHIHVVALPKGERQKQTKSNLDGCLAATWEALSALPEVDGKRDASPDALRALAERVDAFAPIPRLLPITDILLDTWSLTCVDDLPGRPPPERWLHGVEAGEPDLNVAWRAELHEVLEWNQDERRFIEAAPGALKVIFDKHPVLARERLRGPLSEVLAELGEVANATSQAGPIGAVLIPVHGDPIAGELGELLKNKPRLANATIVLPCEAGGLDERGMLDCRKAGVVADVADERTIGAGDQRQRGAGERRRMRILLTRDAMTQEWRARLLGQDAEPVDQLDDKLSVCICHSDAAAKAREHFGLAQKALLVLDRDDDGQPTKLLQLLAEAFSVATVQDDPAASARPQELTEHLDWTAEEAEEIVRECGLKEAAPEIADAVVTAARWHDRGKNRPQWQKAIGHSPPAAGGNGRDWKPRAKSGARGFDSSACGRYRHEFGSQREAAADGAIRDHPERGLILDLIAAHHGWARPHFDPEQWDVADGVTEEQNADLAAETMRRFARLQRRFGHWGLAWLEALVRAADYAATARIERRDA